MAHQQSIITKDRVDMGDNTDITDFILSYNSIFCNNTLFVSHFLSKNFPCVMRFTLYVILKKWLTNKVLLQKIELYLKIKSEISVLSPISTRVKPQLPSAFSFIQA